MAFLRAFSVLYVEQAEAPILIQPFMKDITQSEMFAVMTGGFASIAGALMGALAAYGVRSLLLFRNSPGYGGLVGDGEVYVSALARKNSLFPDTGSLPLW